MGVEPEGRRLEHCQVEVNHGKQAELILQWTERTESCESEPRDTSEIDAAPSADPNALCPIYPV